MQCIQWRNASFLIRFLWSIVKTQSIIPAVHLPMSTEHRITNRDSWSSTCVLIDALSPAHALHINVILKKLPIKLNKFFRCFERNVTMLSCRLARNCKNIKSAIFKHFNRWWRGFLWNHGQQSMGTTVEDSLLIPEKNHTLFRGCNQLGIPWETFQKFFCRFHINNSCHNS